MPKACNLQKGHVVSINDQPYQVKAIKVHTPSARGANTLYKVRFNCVSTGQKLDQTLKGNDLLEEVDRAIDNLDGDYLLPVFRLFLYETD